MSNMARLGTSISASLCSETMMLMKCLFGASFYREGIFYLSHLSDEQRGQLELGNLETIWRQWETDTHTHILRCVIHQRFEDVSSGIYIKRPFTKPVEMFNLLAKETVLRIAQTEWLIGSYRNELEQSPVFQIRICEEVSVRMMNSYFFSLGKELRNQLPKVMETLSSSWCELINADTGTGKTLMALLRAGYLLSISIGPTFQFGQVVTHGRPCCWLNENTDIARDEPHRRIFPLLIVSPDTKLDDWQHELQRIDWSKVFPRLHTFITMDVLCTSLQRTRKLLNTTDFCPPIVLCNSNALKAFRKEYVMTLIIDELGNAGSGRTLEGLNNILPLNVHHLLYVNATPPKERFPESSLGLLRHYRETTVASSSGTPVNTIVRRSSPTSLELELFEIALKQMSQLLLWCCAYSIPFSNFHTPGNYIDRILKLCCRVFEGSGPMMSPQTLEELLQHWFELGKASGLHSTSATATALLTLPTKTASHPPLGDVTICWICHDVVNEDLVQSPCRHLVHWSCIQVWLRHGKQCYCKQTVPLSDFTLPFQLNPEEPKRKRSRHETFRETVADVQGNDTTNGSSMSSYRDDLDSHISNNGAFTILRSKINTAVEICLEEQQKGHRGVAFTTSSHETQLLRQALNDVGLNNVVLPRRSDDIAKTVKQVRADDSLRVLIIPHEKTLGMNLDFCSYYVRINTKWCQKKHKQDQGRITRGHTEEVRMYHILQPSGIDAIAHSLPRNGITCLRQTWILAVLFHNSERMKIEEYNDILSRTTRLYWYKSNNTIQWTHRDKYGIEHTTGYSLWSIWLKYPEFSSLGDILD